MSPGPLLPSADSPLNEHLRYDVPIAIHDQQDRDRCAEPPTTHPQPQLSIVVPLKDEADSLIELFDRIQQNTRDRYTCEVIFVDDGSHDRSWEVIRLLHRRAPHQVRGIQFRHNTGKATALLAGFRAAQGDIIITMDADLQDDPVEIPRLTAKLDEGFDLVSGWKRVRRDPWHKVIPSRFFNRFASFLGGVRLHDHNCGFKCYRREVVQRLDLHGELHRMIPTIAAMHGYRSAEIEVRHHARRNGRSKYGLERIVRGLSDAVTVGFLRRFSQRPSHFFNTVSLLYLAVGTVLASCGWVSLGLAFSALAPISFLCGLMSELIIRGPLDISAVTPIRLDTGKPNTQLEGPNDPLRDAAQPESLPAGEQ